MGGAAIGTMIFPGVGTAIGAGVGAIVGTVAEGFKIFSDPNSSLRKGLSASIDWMGEKLSGAWDTVSEWGSDIASWASDTWSSVSEGFSSFTSSVMDVGSDLLSSAGDMLGDAYDWASEGLSSIGTAISESSWNPMNWFAMGGIAKGGFRAFASGGTVTEPTLGMVGEGQYNEAIVPLPDGKSIPVQMGGSGGGGGAGNGEVIALLQKLITVVEQGGDVYLDGNKVGKSLALANSQMG